MHKSTTAEEAVQSLQALGLPRTTARSITAFALCLQWNERFEPSTEPVDEPAVPIDDLFDVLSHRRRRYVLYCLYQHDESVNVDSLAQWIVCLEEGKPPKTVSQGDVKRAETDLYHSQLPKLADAQLLTYDRDTNSTEIADEGFQIQPYLLIAVQDDLGHQDVPLF